MSAGRWSSRRSSTWRAVLRLRELILNGEFAPGRRVSEAPLSGRLGVSRTPLRLALERLAHEGLLEPYPTGGFIVRRFTLDDVWDGIEVRGLLEGAAARLAAERLRDERDVHTGIDSGVNRVAILVGQSPLAVEQRAIDVNANQPNHAQFRGSHTPRSAPRRTLHGRAR